jgi:ATP-dependent Zn protease
MKLCPPALIYLIFSAAQIIIDTIKGLYNTAIFKFIIMVMVTFLLNSLCLTGLSVVSWVIVFIPFILMTVIVTMLLYIFGLDIASGKFDYDDNDNDNDNENKNNTNVNDVNGIIVINKKNNSVDYVKNEPTYNIVAPKNNKQNAVVIPPYYSSDPSYESFQ